MNSHVFYILILTWAGLLIPYVLIDLTNTTRHKSPSYNGFTNCLSFRLPRFMRCSIRVLDCAKPIGNNWIRRV